MPSPTGCSSTWRHPTPPASRGTGTRCDGRRELRARLRKARDSRLILSAGREAYVEASRPLVEAMRADGMAADAAVQACRLLMWATVGFGAVESGVEPPPQAPARDPPRWRPRGCRRRRDRHALRSPHSLHRRRHHERSPGRRRALRQKQWRNGGPMTIPSLDANGKVVVVTGGSKGLGRAMALGFAEAGADVVVASRKLDPCEEVAAEIRAWGERHSP